jgi:hypothetical protein
MSFLDPIRSRAISTPDELSIVDCSGPLEALSYRELVQLAAALAKYLADVGISKREYVSARIQDNAILVLVILALEAIGVQTVDFTNSNVPGSKVISDLPQRIDDVVVDASRIRLLASQRAAFGASSFEAIQTIIFLSDVPDSQTHSMNGSIVAARMSGRALARQSSLEGGWLCAAQVRGELGFSCVMQLLGAGQAVGLSSGNLQGDVQLADLYSLRSLYVTSGNISSYVGAQATAHPLRYLPRRVAVAGNPVPWNSIRDTIGGLATETLVTWDLPECGAVALAKFHPAEEFLRFTPAPDCSLELWSSDGDPAGAGQIVVHSPTLHLQGSEPGRWRDDRFVSSVRGRREGAQYVMLL